MLGLQLVNKFFIMSCFYLQSKVITNSIFFDAEIRSTDCPYEAPDECTGKEPQSCCAGASGARPQAGVYWLPYTLVCAISVAALVL